MTDSSTRTTVEQWDVFEAEFQASAEKPFTEVDLTARFAKGHRTLAVRGFHDGGQTYRLRFCPDDPGPWRYVTQSNVAELDGRSGQFTCLPATDPGNHGPVTVDRTHHFRYADGRGYPCIGTTSYAWIHQDPSLAEQTLATLADSPFDKLRMTIFPKSYTNPMNFVGGDAMLHAPLAPGSARGLLRTSPGRARG